MKYIVAKLKHHIFDIRAFHSIKESIRKLSISDKMYKDNVSKNCLSNNTSLVFKYVFLSNTSLLSGKTRKVEKDVFHHVLSKTRVLSKKK